MKYCTSCGNEMPDDARFCTACGAPNDAVNEAPAQEPEFPQTEPHYAAPAEPAKPAEPAQPAQPAEPAQPAPMYEQPAAPVFEQPAQPAFEQPQQDAFSQPSQPFGGYQAPQQNTFNQPQQNTFNGQPAQPGGYYQPPQAGTMPNANAYNYTGTPVQGPGEEKASVGLAILSFFIPLAGLIIFAAKKKDRPKTAKTCLIVAVVSIIIGIVGSAASQTLSKKAIDDAYSGINDIVSENSDELDGWLDDEDGPVWGSVEGSTYKNEYFEIMYNLPEGMRFETAEEFVGDDADYTIDAESGVPTIVEDGATFYYDSYAINDNLGTSIMTIAIPDSDAVRNEVTTETDILDIFVDSMAGDDANAEVSDYAYEYIGDDLYLNCNIVTHGDGYDLEYSYYVLEEDGNYFIILIGSNDYDSMTNADYAALFTSID